MAAHFAVAGDPNSAPACTLPRASNQDELRQRECRRGALEAVPGAGGLTRFGRQAAGGPTCGVEAHEHRDDAHNPDANRGEPGSRPVSTAITRSAARPVTYACTCPSQTARRSGEIERGEWKTGLPAWLRPQG